MGFNDFNMSELEHICYTLETANLLASTKSRLTLTENKLSASEKKLEIALSKLELSERKLALAENILGTIGANIEILKKSDIFYICKPYITQRHINKIEDRDIYNP